MVVHVLFNTIEWGNKREDKKGLGEHNLRHINIIFNVIMDNELYIIPFIFHSPKNEQHFRSCLVFICERERGRACARKNAA